MDGLKGRRPGDVQAAIEQAKSLAQDKKVPLTAERLAAALNMDLSDFQTIASGECAGNTPGQRQAAKAIRAAWREALASVTEYAMQKGSGAQMPLLYLKNNGDGEKQKSTAPGPVYFVGEDELPE